PTLRRVGEAFKLGLRADDRWGNPSGRVSGEFRLRSNFAVENLPERVRIEEGRAATIFAGLVARAPGDLVVEVLQDDRVVATSNPCRIQARAERVHFWADLHGQSEETIGTNSARELVAFARD